MYCVRMCGFNTSFLVRTCAYIIYCYLYPSPGIQPQRDSFAVCLSGLGFCYMIQVILINVVHGINPKSINDGLNLFLSSLFSLINRHDGIALRKCACYYIFTYFNIHAQIQPLG